MGEGLANPGLSPPQLGAGGGAVTEPRKLRPQGLTGCVSGTRVLFCRFGLLCVCVGESADAGGSGKGGEQEEGA